MKRVILCITSVFLFYFMFVFNNIKTYAKSEIDYSYYFEDSDYIYNIDTLEYSGYSIQDYRNEFFGTKISSNRRLKVEIYGDDPIVNIIPREKFLEIGSEFVSGEEYSYFYITKESPTSNCLRTDVCIIDTENNINEYGIDSEINAIEETMRVQQYNFYTIKQTGYAPGYYQDFNVVEFKNGNGPSLDNRDSWVIVPFIGEVKSYKYEAVAIHPFYLGNFNGACNLGNLENSNYNDGLYFIDSDIILEGKTTQRVKIEKNNTIDCIIKFSTDKAMSTFSDELFEAIFVGVTTTSLQEMGIKLALDFVFSALENFYSSLVNDDYDIVVKYTTKNEVQNEEYSTIRENQIALYGKTIKTIAVGLDEGIIGYEDEYVTFKYRYSAADGEANYPTRIKLAQTFNIYYNGTMVGENCLVGNTYDIYEKESKEIDVYEKVKNQYCLDHYINIYKIEGHGQFINVEFWSSDFIIRFDGGSLNGKVLDENGCEVIKQEKGYFLEKDRNYYIHVSSNYEEYEQFYGIEITTVFDPNIRLNPKETIKYKYSVQEEGWYTINCDSALCIDGKKESNYYYFKSNKEYLLSFENNTNESEEFEFSLKKMEKANISLIDDKITINNLVDEYMYIVLPLGDYRLYFSENDYSNFVVRDNKGIVIDGNDFNRIEMIDVPHVIVNDRYDISYASTYDNDVYIVGEKAITIKCIDSNGNEVNAFKVYSDDGQIISENDKYKFKFNDGESKPISIRYNDYNIVFIAHYQKSEKFELTYSTIRNGNILLNIDEVSEEETFDYIVNNDKTINQVELHKGINKNVIIEVPKGKHESYYNIINVKIYYTKGKYSEITIYNSVTYEDLRLLYFEVIDENTKNLEDSSCIGYYKINTTTDFIRMISIYKYMTYYYDDGINYEAVEVNGNFNQYNFIIMGELDFQNKTIKLDVPLMFCGNLVGIDKVISFYRDEIVKYYKEAKISNLNVEIDNSVVKDYRYYAIFDKNYGRIEDIKFENCKINIKYPIEHAALGFIMAGNYGIHKNVAYNEVKVTYIRYGKTITENLTEGAKYI